MEICKFKLKSIFMVPGSGTTLVPLSSLKNLIYMFNQFISKSRSQCPIFYFIIEINIMFYVRKHISFILITGDFFTINSVLFAEFPVFLNIFQFSTKLLKVSTKLLKSCKNLRPHVFGIRYKVACRSQFERDGGPSPLAPLLF